MLIDVSSRVRRAPMHRINDHDIQQRLVGDGVGGAGKSRWLALMMVLLRLLLLLLHMIDKVPSIVQ
jgi:hypothetical protein